MEDRLAAYLEEVRAGIADQQASMRGLLAREEKFQETLLEELRDSKERERRLTRSLQALDPVAKATQPKRNRTGSSNTWKVTRERVEEIYAWVSEQDEEVTVPQTAKAVGMSHETVRRAFKALRDEERLRLVGQTPNGHGVPTRRFATMPALTEAVSNGR